MFRCYLFLRCNARQLPQRTQIVRLHASSAHHDASDIRNMALVAHIDSGKTTLTESILHKSSYLISPGSVDTGSTTTDFLPAERERGITIQSASIPVKWKHWTFNLIDTPGHADFGMEVESASRVVDGAVLLIDSVEGVEAQTTRVWSQLSRYDVPTKLVFLNKLDRPGASFRSSLRSLVTHKLHPNPLVITLPIASMDPDDYTRAEPGIQGLVDLVKWELWKWSEDGQSSVQPLPLAVDTPEFSRILPHNHPLVPCLSAARTALLENLAMFSEELMEQLLSLPSVPSPYLHVEPQAIIPHLRMATLQNQVLPVLCGSAMKNIGTELVMDYVGELLASPVDVRLEKESANDPLRLLAWKVSWNKRKGWMTFVRVYSGSVTRHSSLFNVNTGQRERVSKLLLLYASQAEEVDNLPFGSVGVLLGLKHTRTGDTLVNGHVNEISTLSETSLRGVTLPPAVMSVSVIPNSHSDLAPVENALQALIRTDPSVRMDMQDGQILVHGLGALHLEIIEGRLRDEWGAKFEVGSRQVSYRESTYAAIPAQIEEWSTEVAGRLFFVRVGLSVAPLTQDEQGDPAFDGNLVLDGQGCRLMAPDSYSDQLNPMANVARGVASALSISPHTLLPISHVKVQITSFGFPRGAPPSVLTGACSYILRSKLKAAGMGPLLEPFVKLKVSVQENIVGRVVQDITENGGEVLDLASDSSSVTAGEDDEEPYAMDGVYIPPDELSPSSVASSGASTTSHLKRTVHAIAPLSRVLDYSTRLRALSAGYGTFDMINAGFREVTGSRKMEILREIGRA
ncbi:P-loop containing nucleoside triphosphate hydrolase protein [Phlebopus sp. FC_14]|nr:P-loop containing nucleoside triphosphate hydrolase protein [Phlebopus sp. FC_14]